MILISLWAKVRNLFNPHMNLLEEILFAERSKYMCLITLMWFSSTETICSLTLLFACLVTVRKMLLDCFFLRFYLLQLLPK